MYIFGGFEREGDRYYNDMWMFDTGKYSLFHFGEPLFFLTLLFRSDFLLDTLTFHKVETHGNIPEGRCGHSATLVDGKIWIFGGRVKVPLGSGIFSGTGLQYRNDLYCFDPGTESFFNFSFFSVSQPVLTKKLVTAEWVRYEPRGIGPSGRAMHTSTPLGRKIYIFGGANSSGQGDDTSGFCDLYELDIGTSSRLFGTKTPKIGVT